MSRPRLFVLAMYAMRLDPERLHFTPQPDGTVSWVLKETLEEESGIFPEVSLWAAGAVASSVEEARALGMQRLLEERPWQEGWVNHHVTVNAVPRDLLLKAVRWSAEGAPAEGSEQEEPPELLM